MLGKLYINLTLTVTAQLTRHWKGYQLSKPEIELDMMEEMYAALCIEPVKIWSEHCKKRLWKRYETVQPTIGSNIMTSAVF